MQYGGVASNEFNRFNPLVFGQIERQNQIAVFNGARRRNSLRRDVDDHVWLAVAPFNRRDFVFGKRISCAVILGAAIDPVHEFLSFFYGDVVYAVELVRILNVDLTRRHALGDQRLTNHRRPALNHLVAAHSERRDTAFLVTCHTALL